MFDSGASMEKDGWRTGRRLRTAARDEFRIAVVAGGSAETSRYPGGRQLN